LESARGDSIFSLTERIVFLMLFVFCACALTEFQRQKIIPERDRNILSLCGQKCAEKFHGKQLHGMMNGIKYLDWEFAKALLRW
jgi:hypothetical protein